MPQPPNNDIYYQNANVVSELVREKMLPDLPLLSRIPFTIVDQKTVIAKRKTYTVDTDPYKKLAAPGDNVLAAWPTVTLSQGDAVSLGTTMRKTRAEFTSDDTALGTFAKDVMECYASAAWNIADQINASLVSAMTAGALAQNSIFSAKNGGNAWSGNADPIGDIRAVAQDIKQNKGYKLDTVVVHTDNYQEMFDFLQTNDVDMDYARTQVAPQSLFYEEITYLKIPGCWVVGVSGDTGLAEGSILGIGTFKGTRCVENLAYFDPKFGNAEVVNGDTQGIGPANIPLNVNPYPMPDGRVNMVEMWIDSVPNVANGYGVFYDTGI
jgi:hypothetical protein